MNRIYSQYRDSGVDWLGEIPAHWVVLHLGFALLEAVGGGTPATSNEEYWADVDEEGLPWVAIADMSGGGTVVATQKRVTHAGLVSKRLKPLSAGTIIYSMYASVGAVARLGIRAVTNQAILGLLPGESLTRDFLYWWLTGIRNSVLAFTRSNTQSNLNAETVSKLPLVLPPLDDQRSITESLNREMNKVDTLIAKKRLLIERLEEYRTALISRTVTRGLPPDPAQVAGLNPRPRLKPSGVEWLGEIPEHWEVNRLSHIANYRTSSVDKKVVDGEVPVRLCNYTDVYYNERVSASDGDFMRATATEREVQGFRLAVGDVVITKDSEDWRDIGVPALIEDSSGDFVCGYHLGIVRPGESAIPAYVFRLMQSTVVNRQLQVAASGVTRYGLPRAAVSEALIPLPPLEEQQAIAEFLDRETGRIDSLFSRVEVAIERLLEYRTALITAAVTGKIDVRDSVGVGGGVE